MADTAALVVALSAQLTKFEKDMQKAGIMAEKAAGDIEDKFSKINPQINASALGNMLSNAVSKAVDAAGKALTEFYARFSTLRKEASILGENMRDIFAFQEVAKQGGSSIENATAGLRRMAELLAEMQRGDKNSLSALFDANPVLKGVNRETLTLQQTLQIVATLIQDTRKGVEKIEVGRLAGFAEDTALSLGKAGTALTAMQQSAAAAAPNLDKMADQAKAFEGYMEKSWTWLKAMAAISLQGLHAALTVPTAYTDQQVEMLRAAKENAQALKPGSQTLKSEAERAADRAAGRRYGTEADNLAPTGPGTQLPKQKQPAGATEADAFERANDQITKHIALMKADTEAAGANVYEKERLRTEAALMEGMRRKLNLAEGEAITLTEKQTKRIAAQADAAGRGAQALAEANFKVQQINSASQQLGSAVSTAFSDAIVEGKKLNEVLDSLVKTLLKAAINSSIMSLFTPGAGGTVPLLSMLGIGKRMAGGPVSAGSPYVVGERGPELMIPNQSGMVMPNSALGRGGAGGVTMAPVYNINAAGADAGTVERIQRVLATHARMISGQGQAMITTQRFQMTGVG
jgi:hypothetical protein